MATFTITAPNTNIDSLASKTGGDIYNVNGGQLVVDQDSRYGQNQSTSASIAAMTISATLGGEILFDGSGVRLIPYNSGSGNVPALNTLVTQGGVTGKLIGVWGSLTAAPTAVGAAMPATGWIKIKQKAGGNFAAGALTNIGATATGADIVGWLEIVGDEAATCTVPRLGTFRVTGEWYELGNTNGAANQQLQIPTSGSLLYFPGIFIEKTAGGGDFEFYPNAGSQTSVATDIRAKVCWITTGGLIRIGHNGTANAGFVPGSGLRVVIPNVFFQNCTTAARTANVLPNATLATRYDFTTTGGGVIDIDKAAMAWYLSLAQPFQVEITNSATLEQISITECATEVILDTFGVGQTAAQAQVGLILGLNFAGVTMTDCHFSRATLAASGAYTSTITDCEDVQGTNVSFTALTVKGNATSGNLLATRMNNSSFTTTKLTNGRIVLVTCANVTINGTSYADVITGTTTTTAAQTSYVFELQSNCQDVTITGGVNFFGLTNVQAYLGILNIAAAGCTRIKLRNIGTRSAPLNLGSTNNGAYLFVLATGAAANDVRVQRCYVSNTRTGLYTGDNSSTKILIENCAGDYADAPVTPMLNATLRAIGATHAVTAQTACYGTHWFDIFTSTTAGRLGILMNEATALTTAQIVLESGAKFTSAGGLYMPTIGMRATFEMPYFAKGIDSFQNSAAVMGGGTIGNYTLEYQIDKNNGAGYNGTWKTLNGANLSGETGLSPSLGTRIKIRITTSTTNSTAITSLYVLTNSNTTAQDYQYPLDTFTLTVDGIVTGSDVVVYEAGTETILGNVDAQIGTSWDFEYETPEAVDIGVFLAGYVPFYIRNYSLASADASVPVAQVVDRAYLL
jgi:hypothetical protein